MTNLIRMTSFMQPLEGINLSYLKSSVFMYFIVGTMLIKLEQLWTSKKNMLHLKFRMFIVYIYETECLNFAKKKTSYFSKPEMLVLATFGINVKMWIFVRNLW